MPYIIQEERPQYDNILSQMPKIKNKGHLEYGIYKLMKYYMKGKDYNYSNLHETVYAVVHSAHEFERNTLDKREDYAITKNGDIE